MSTAAPPSQASPPAAAPGRAAPAAPPPFRTVLGGFLMGCANLVPGVSGGTMILAVGLYDAFIGAVAKLTSMRWSVGLFVFLGLFGLAAVVAIVGLAGPAVWLVSQHRWIAYSIFIGLTLGGVPELVRLCRPARPTVWISLAAGFALMAWVAFGAGRTAVEVTPVTLVLIAALAASSMILPGISGSTMLLIFGMYDIVIGSISLTELREDFAGSIRILVPVAIGVALGIGVLSNVLKVLLARFPRASHGGLLGLLLGSLLVIVPFQEAVHPELVRRDDRKAIEMLAEGAQWPDVVAVRAPSFGQTEAETYRERYAGLSRGDIRMLSNELRHVTPTAARLAISAALVLAGFLVTRFLGEKPSKHGG